MSQRRRAMELIEKESGLKGLILRPLSAKLFEPTIPEKQGLVDREKLLSIEGRCRKPQIELAKKFNINDYPCPSGGCLLTYEGFAKKVVDLMKHKPDFNLHDVLLLKIGRHFRITECAKFIVGKDEHDNKKLSGLAKDGEIIFYPVGVKGPIGIATGVFDNGFKEIAAGIIARYSDLEEGQKLMVEYKNIPQTRAESIIVNPIDEQILSTLRIS
jgi:hypothetical protein